MNIYRSRIIFILFSLSFFVAVINGCAQQKYAVKDAGADEKGSVTTLQALKVSADASQIELAADKPLVYTYYKTSDPPKILIDLSQTDPASFAKSLEVNAGNVKSIEVSRHDYSGGFFSRVEVSLVKEGEFAVKADPADKGKLLVTIGDSSVKDKVTNEVETKVVAKAGEADTIHEQAPGTNSKEPELKTEEVKPAVVAAAEPVPETKPPVANETKPLEKPALTDPVTAEKPAAEPMNKESKTATTPATITAPQQRVVKALNVGADGINIDVDGGVDKYKAFALDKPSRLVVDIIGAKDGIKAKSVPLDGFGLVKARIGLSADKVRIVFDAKKEIQMPYYLVKNDTGLQVLFGAAATAAMEKGKSDTASGSAEKQTKAEEKPVASAPAGEQIEKPIVTQVNKDVDAPTAKPGEEPAASSKTSTTAEEKPKAVQGPASVEEIDFKLIDGYSRIAIKVSGACVVGKPTKVKSGLSLNLKQCQLPKKLQRMLDTGSFASVVKGVTPYSVKTKSGLDTRIVVKLRAAAPSTVKQEADVIYWDIQNTEVPKSQPRIAELHKAQPKASEPFTTGEDAELLTKVEEVSAKPQTQVRVDGKKYTGRKVTLEFSDADIRKIFQLIAEVSNLNFLIADDVSGTISLKLVNVPWDQALDVILDSKGLEMKREGNIVQIKPKGKFKSIEQADAEAKKAREKQMDLQTAVFDINYASVSEIAGQLEKLKSQHDNVSVSVDTRTNRVIVTDIAPSIEKMRELIKTLDMPEKQVMIEARIVEASSTFARDMGVQWTIGYSDGNASIAGINSLNTSFGGVVSNVLPSGNAGGIATGVSFGRLASNVQIDMRLSAAATSGLVKIISTPKVVTLNNKAAKISQGQSIPYQTTSAEGTRTEFIEAALTLEVTPHITADGNIAMKIRASNNSPGTGAPPPINKKEATTELAVKNGETTVIGGIYVDSDTESDTGVPFLKDIPLLGWLFKSNSKSKSKTELLIFITPKILT